MNPRLIFRLVVAVSGLYVMWVGTRDLLSAIIVTLHLYDEPTATAGMERAYAVQGLIELILGFLLVAGFFPLERIAFPADKDEPGES
jgi:hypothetical protein